MKPLPTYQMADYDQEIEHFYQSGVITPSMSLVDRVSLASEYFLGRSYLLGALGEGPDGEFDQSPRYRTDAFDCVTYVNTVLALALAQNLKQFQHHILRLNYYDAKPLYHHRHHFMTIDWNSCNAVLGLIEEFSDQIVNDQGQPIYRTVEATIDRPNWIKSRKLADIKLLSSIKRSEAKLKLNDLHSLAEDLRDKTVCIPYLPLTELLDDQSKPNHKLFLQIPKDAIIEVIRPQWDLRDKIGTPLLVSHLGFAIWKNNQLIFRHVSQIEKIVIDLPLKDYLSRYLHHETVKGINIQKLNNVQWASA